MTQELRWVSEWAQKWNASFNLGKCSALALSRKRPTPKPRVRFQGTILQVPQTDQDLEEHAKYLGVVLDNRLTWRLHLTRVRAKALKRLELLLRITNTRYGARHTRVLLLYKICVRPALEYACPIWNDASAQLKTSLIDNVQHQVLARAMGVRKSTSREALEVETGIEPLELRRKMLTARTYERLLTSTSKVARVLKAHRDKRVTVLHSALNASFALRAEALVSDTGAFPKGCDEDKRLKEVWQIQWDASTVGRWFYQLQPRVKFRAAPWARNMPRWIVSTLAGMRLGNSAARHDLHRSGLEPSPDCECGLPETRAHYWLGCSIYARERDELQSRVSWSLKQHVVLNIGVLLGFSNRSSAVRTEIREAVVEYLRQTGRFKPQ